MMREKWEGRAAFIAGLGALATAAVGLFFALGGKPSRAPAEIDAAAQVAQVSLSGALASLGRKLDTEVTVAASLPQLRAAVDDGVDSYTLQDLFSTEKWWTPYRERVCVVVGPNGPLVTHGENAGALSEPPALARARRRETGPAVAAAGGRPYLVSTANISEGGKQGTITLLFGQPLDPATLNTIAAQTGLALIVSDGRKALDVGGVAQMNITIDPGKLVGHERGTIAEVDGSWAATPVALGPSLWVWGVRPLPPPGAAHSPAPALASLAVALGLLAAALAMKARQARKDPLALAVSAAAAGHQQPIITQFTDPDVIRSVMAPPGARTGARYSTAERRVLLGRYTLLTHLGEGGMSDVYTAALTGPEGFRRTFVLKRLKPELAHNRGAVDQFIDEANLGSTLVHPNIVPIFDFGEAGGSYFLAQEYIVGKNLEELIMRHAERMGRGLDAASVFYIAHEILKGLSFAHQKTDEDGEPLRIVHRDISPSNLMISVLGEVKLLDFGIMKAEGRVSRTEMGNVKGNVAFMAPEQARGGVVDARSDIFSLGAVMFHALTNEPFYTGETSTELFYRATVGPTDEHQQRIGRLDPTVARIITKAVSNNPALRYQTADEFAEDLAVEVNAAAARELSALIHALFGAELRPVNGISGGGGRGGGTGLPRKPATL